MSAPSTSRSLPGRGFSSCRIAALGPLCAISLPGHIDMIVDQASNSMQQVREGQIQGLCRYREGTPGRGAGYSHGRRSWDCRASTSIPGTACGRRRGRRTTSSPARLIAPWWDALADLNVRKRFCLYRPRDSYRPSNRRRKRLGRFSASKSRNGGRSLRPPCIRA